MIGGMYISVMLILIEIVSVYMLVMTSVRHPGEKNLPFTQRIGMLAVMVGLIAHIITHLGLVLIEYREPRTWSWLWFYMAVNYLIWERYIRITVERMYSKRKGYST